MEPGTPDAQIHDLTPVTEIDRRSYAALDAVLEQREKRQKQERAETVSRWKFRAKIAAAVFTVLAGGGTYGLVELKPDDAPPIMPSDLKQDVKKALDKSEANSKQIRALGKVTVKGLDYLGRKIDAAHPEVSVVEKPPELQDAEKELAEQETDTKVDKALGLLKGETDGM